MAAPTLEEDEIDDILYYARTNPLAELKELLDSLSPRGSPSAILVHAVDPSTGNTALHMSAANGHIGTLLPLCPFALRRASSSTSYHVYPY